MTLSFLEIKPLYFYLCRTIEKLFSEILKAYGFLNKTAKL